MTAKKAFGWFYLAVMLLAFAGGVALVAWYTPQEATMGAIQKVFYLHLPVAITTFLACVVCFVGSIGYLAQHKPWWDDLAAAGARVAVQFCAVVLLTGMIWARGAWGTWWTWSPRLTFSLLLFLLYLTYLMTRASIESRQRRAVVCAVYGLVAFLDVPLVYLSVRLMPDIHPTSVELAAPMKLTLGLWFVPVLLLGCGLVWAQYRVNRARRLAAEAKPEPAGFSPVFKWKTEAL